ncbi:acyl-CoA dehydrogenase [Sinorhizobium meliloti]|uniref:acyl-CoA dehydrogenase n=1 Tax=Rhizobium meliloti TaxID=382 RepID=UPI0013E3E097|nr:acyl-CoA dehydrogenase [Sinorhizobium meliloti]
MDNYRQRVGRADVLLGPTNSDAREVGEIRRILSGSTKDEHHQLLIRLLSGPGFEKPNGLPALEQHRSVYRRLAMLAAQLPAEAGDLTDPSLFAAVAEWTAVNDPSLCVAALIHYGLCIGSLVELGKGNGRAERYAQELAAGRKFGAFMISELGGGNSQLATRTEARFDSRTREFVIHTPDDGALKVGNVSINHLDNMGILCARLIVADVDCGVFAFAVDLSTPQPLPGVRLSKPMEMPLVPFDYGLVGFDQVRVPFDAWLSDGATIDAAARFHDPLDSTRRLARTLTAAQNVWVPGAIGLAAAARTCAAQALHFSAHRTSMARVGREVPLLFYSTQQRAIFRALATSSVMTCLVNDATRDWADALQRRSKLDDSLGASMMWAPWSTTNRKLSLVKALTAWATEEVATQCRQQCGVAGVLLVNRFLDYLGLGQVFNDASGNNFLILLDTARMLTSGTILPTESPAAGREWAEADFVLEALRIRERRLICSLTEGVAERTAQGLDLLDVWNPLLSSARDAAEAYGLNLAIDAAIAATNSAADELARALLRDLTLLFVFDRAHRHAAWLINEGLLEAKQYTLLEAAIDRLCDRLLPHAETLIGSFGSPQPVIRSPIADPTQQYATALARKLAIPPAGAFGMDTRPRQ